MVLPSSSSSPQREPQKGKAPVGPLACVRAPREASHSARGRRLCKSPAVLRMERSWLDCMPMFCFQRICQSFARRRGPAFPQLAGQTLPAGGHFDLCWLVAALFRYPGCFAPPSNGHTYGPNACLHCYTHRSPFPQPWRRQALGRSVYLLRHGLFSRDVALFSAASLDVSAGGHWMNDKYPGALTFRVTSERFMGRRSTSHGGLHLCRGGLHMLPLQNIMPP
ncbi:hypothetical protein CSOJ01_09958 [Colletotrichum sojae]|uniref:Uncharacterized protein n=1 Tax=Colletotrichum sojae TaxID=2175907 RepID=A0A8H6MQN5_9PEZI|nr:hypothetical protein CSOJ01_09958 [Colletotrichum sojae]